MSLGLNQPLGPVSWSSNLTYTLNKNKIKDFHEVVNSVTGEFTVNYLKLASYGQLAEERLVPGGSIGDIYVSTFRKDAAGNVLSIHRPVCRNEVMTMYMLVILLRII